MNQERLGYIDWMKTIGMLFIMIGHFASSVMSIVAFSFSVQLFFFISGFLFKRQDDLRNVLYKNITSLLIPYWIWGTLLILYLFFRTQILSNLGKSIIGLCLGLNNYQGVRGCGELWFIVTLLELKCIFQFIRAKSDVLTVVCIFVASVLSIIYRYVIKDSSLEYFGIGLFNVFIAAPFFVLGYYLSRYKDRITELSNSVECKWLLVLLVSIAILLYLALKNGWVLMVYGQYGAYYMLYLICGFLGIFCSWIVASFLSKMSKSSFCYYIGIGTIVILATNVGIINLIKPLLLTEMSSDSFSYNLLSCIIAALLLILYLPAIKLFQRYMPFLIGNR